MSNNQNLINLFERQATLSPSKIAITYQDQQLTYFEINSRINRLAQHLQSLHIGYHDRVCIYLDNSPELIIAILAAIKILATYVIISPELSSKKQCFIFKDSNCKLIILESHLIENFHTYDLEVKVVLLDEIHNALMLYSSENLYCSYDEKEHDINSQILAIYYTSGSTGDPKGVMVRHISVASRILWHYREYPKIGDETILARHFISTISLLETIGALIFGIKIIIMTRNICRNLPTIRSIVANQNSNVKRLCFTPNLLGVLLSHEPEFIAGFRNIKLWRIVGEAIHYSLLEKFFIHFDSVIVNHYGLTEFATQITKKLTIHNEKTIAFANTASNSDTKVYVLNSDNNIAKNHEVGEICLSGNGIAAGYLNLPELTKQKFVDNPFAIEGMPEFNQILKTGDLGKILSNGDIIYVGRSDDQIKICGYAVNIAEIENALKLSTIVKNAVVVLADTGDKYNELAAYIVCCKKIEHEKEEETIIKDIKLHLTKYLPYYMIPNYYILLDELPVLTNNKIDRKALPTLARTQQAITPKQS